tara:strand:+ start:3775 stop:4155 length:381 start_codon:yes stop_codon:yes gene_type:complete
MRTSYIVSAIEVLKPKAQFVLRGDTYADLEWLDESQTKPTEDEINTKVAELKTAEPMRLLRIERDKRIATSDWRIVKAKETSTNIPAAWKTYRQALRDLPASSDPKLIDDTDFLDMSSVTWPTPPS